MDERLKKLLEWLQRNQSGNPYAKEMPFHPWGKKGIKPRGWDWNPSGPSGAIPMPEIGRFGDLPEYDPESEWYNPNWREEREKNLPEGHLLHLIPPSQAERYSILFNPGGMMKPKWTPEQGGGDLKNPKWTPGQGGGTLKNVGEDPTLPIRIRPNDLGFGGRVSNLPERVEPTATPDFWKKRTPYFPRGGDTWEQLLNKAKVGSAMHGRGTPSYYPGNRRENMERMRGPQLGGVPEGDRKFVDTMHNIQNAYYTGADFGYEEGWPEQLGATQEQIDMFMAVPEGAIRHAMENPTDAVLQQFEEYYGFPLNVNDPATQRWVDDFKSSKYRKGPSLGFEGVHKNVDGQGMSRLKKDDEGYYAIYDPEGVGSDPSDKRVGARILIPPSMVNNLGLNVGDYIPDDDYIVEHGVLKRKR